MTTIATPSAAPVTFHVLFTPGTVKDLCLFTPSLVAWGNGCRIRVVSNCCSPDEERMLQRLTTLSPRFEFYRLPTNQIWLHGRALSHLQERETGERFAFLDSDIFATGDFLGDLQARAGNPAALFSGLPVWSNEQTETIPRGFQLASGPNFRTYDGFCIGGSYFAIYDNRLLTEFRKAYGLDMRLYLWEDIPAIIRERLTAQGRKLACYDTTKLMVILMNLDGYDCRFLASPHLYHVGGVSATTPPANLPGWIRFKFSRSLPQFVRKVASRVGLYRDWRQQVSAEELRSRAEEAAMRRGVCSHIYQLLQRLNRDESPGNLFRSGDPNLEFAVQHMERILCEQYPQWRAWLDGSEPIVAGEIQRPQSHGGFAA